MLFLRIGHEIEKAMLGFGMGGAVRGFDSAMVKNNLERMSSRGEVLKLENALIHPITRPEPAILSQIQGI
jgi:hypothetical protein